MNRLALSSIASVFLAVSFPEPILANNSLYTQACRYHDAIVAFEDVVKKTRGLQRGDERLVDRLEEEVKRLRTAAKNPRNQNQLRYRYRDIQPMQKKVEDTIFFGRYTLTYDLVVAWEQVIYRQVMFERELAFRVNMGSSNRVQRRINSSQPNRQLLQPNSDTRTRFLIDLR